MVIKIANLRMAHASRLGQKERERERLNDGNKNGQLRIAMPPRVAHAKPPGPILFFYEKTHTDFRGFFLLIMASVRSWPPGPPLVPGVFFSVFCF